MIICRKIKENLHKRNDFATFAPIKQKNKEDYGNGN